MRVLLRAAGAFFLGLSFLALFLAILLMLAPGTEDELIRKAKEEYPYLMIPIIMEHKSEINSITYENTVSYCSVGNYETTDLEIGGISDDYVCGIVEKGYVSSTDELRLHLARKTVAIQLDEMNASYGPVLAQFSFFFMVSLACLVIFSFIAFTFLYFSTENLVEMGFNLVLFSALFAFAYFLLSAILFFILPGIILDHMMSYAEEPLHADLILAAKPAVDEAVQGMLFPPLFLFGLLMLSCSFATASLFIYTDKMQEK